jgi:hypothetical protein
MSATPKDVALYEMVQEGKRLLMQWQRTSKLSDEQKRKLRADTKEHLRKSSTNIVTREA